MTSARRSDMVGILWRKVSATISSTSLAKAGDGPTTRASARPTTNVAKAASCRGRCRSSPRQLATQCACHGKYFALEFLDLAQQRRIGIVGAPIFGEIAGCRRLRNQLAQHVEPFAHQPGGGEGPARHVAAGTQAGRETEAGRIGTRYENDWNRGGDSPRGEARGSSAGDDQSHRSADKIIRDGAETAHRRRRCRRNRASINSG